VNIIDAQRDKEEEEEEEKDSEGPPILYFTRGRALELREKSMFQFSREEKYNQAYPALLLPSACRRKGNYRVGALDILKGHGSSNNAVFAFRRTPQ
jgi:hypothetical protein